MLHLMLVHIRKAELGDVVRVVEIHNAWALENRRDNIGSGFLILTTDNKKIESNLNRRDTIFLVAESDQQVIGYMIGSQRFEMHGNLCWSVDVRKEISSEKHWHASEAAVVPEACGRGVGKGLYKALLREVHGGPLTGYVAVAPLRNEASIRFHEGLGFVAAATFAASEFCGLANYRSILYYLPPQHPLYETSHQGV